MYTADQQPLSEVELVTKEKIEKKQNEDRNFANMITKGAGTPYTCAIRQHKETRLNAIECR